MTESERAEAEIESALDVHGLGPRRLVPISLFQGSKWGRLAFLAECDDGRRVKARHVVDPEAARRLCELREGLESAFAPVLARHGAVLIEEWVEGAPASDEEAEGRAAEAGALLGRLHSTSLPPGTAAEEPTADYVERAQSDLESLLAAESLPGEDGDSLREQLGRDDPGAYRPAVIHRDFCPENFVIGVDGRLAVIDNEWFMVGAAGFDLARTYHRWWMSDRAWADFVEGYRAGAEIPPAMGFWMIASTLFGARVYLRLMPSRLPPLLALLGELSRDRRPFETALR